MSDLDLATLRRLAEAATDGPWYRAKNHSRSRVSDPDNAIGAFDGPYTHYIALVGDGGCHGDTEPQSNADAAFIAAARTAVPELIAEVERLRAELERYRTAVNLAVDAHDDEREGVCCGHMSPCETVRHLREVAL